MTTNFTIICSYYSREFTHRVKSVSMAKFTTQEVEALQKGGNQVKQIATIFFIQGYRLYHYKPAMVFQLAREHFLTNWDMQRMRFPNSR